MVKGSIVAIVTPFDENQNVNYHKLTELLEWHISEGTNGIVILGTTGEAPTLSKEEKLQVFEHTVKVVNKRVPVIAGTGSNNTVETAKFSKQVEDLGVDGLLIVTPYYNKGNNQGLIEHYRLIHDSTAIPIIVYNVPSRTGVKLPLEVITVITQFERIVAIKEASGDLAYLEDIMKIIPNDILVYSGNDDIVYDTLELGGSGVISVAANVIPNVMAKMVKTYFSNDKEESRKIQKQYLELIDSLFIEVNPIPVKKVLNLMGKNVGGYRLPLFEPTTETTAILQQIVKGYQL